MGYGEQGRVFDDNGSFLGQVDFLVDESSVLLGKLDVHKYVVGFFEGNGTDGVAAFKGSLRDIGCLFREIDIVELAAVGKRSSAYQSDRGAYGYSGE